MPIAIVTVKLRGFQGTGTIFFVGCNSFTANIEMNKNYIGIKKCTVNLRFRGPAVRGICSSEVLIIVQKLFFYYAHVDLNKISDNGKYFNSPIKSLRPKFNCRYFPGGSVRANSTVIGIQGQR